jgi:hypothetical protein
VRGGHHQPRAIRIPSFSRALVTMTGNAQKPYYILDLVSSLSRVSLASLHPYIPSLPCNARGPQHNVQLKVCCFRGVIPIICVLFFLCFRRLWSHRVQTNSPHPPTLLPAFLTITEQASNPNYASGMAFSRRFPRKYRLTLQNSITVYLHRPISNSNEFKCFPWDIAMFSPLGISRPR